MLYKVGLLQVGSNNLIPYAWKMYDKNERLCDEFKKTYSRICKPYFIGVWDTVGSVFGKRKRFLDATLNPDVTYAYHAVAVDERRKKFPVSLWDESRKAQHQTIEQVWFPGVHSDVGGSYPEADLSDIALEWMLDKAIGCGLKTTGTLKSSISPDPLGAIHESRKGFWRFWRPSIRCIPKGARIHPSVHARMKNSEMDYDPPNVR